MPTHRSPTKHSPTRHSPANHSRTHQTPRNHTPTHHSPTHEPTHDNPTHHSPTHRKPRNHYPTQHRPTHQIPGRHIPTQHTSRGGGGLALQRKPKLGALSALGQSTPWNSSTIRTYTPTHAQTHTHTHTHTKAHIPPSFFDWSCLQEYFDKHLQKTCRKKGACPPKPKLQGQGEERRRISEGCVWEGTGVWGWQYHCLCVCVCVCRKKVGTSTLVRHNNFACPLVCLACCCAFVGEVNICGVFIVRRLVLMLTH